MAARTRSRIDDSASFDCFDLTIHLGPDNIPWITASSRLGLLHGIPRINANLPALPDLLDQVYDFRDSVQFAEAVPEAPIAQSLGEIVFGDPQLLELFQSTRGAAADRGKSLLVRILASPHLASLPWELLPDPARWNSGDGAAYLTLAKDAHVVRLARGRTYPTERRPLAPPLNLLVVLSSPSSSGAEADALAFDIYEVKRNLLIELQPLIDRGLLVVDVEDRPTRENLRRRISSQPRGYHIFHYVGHALPDRLVLEDESGRRDDHIGSGMSDLLRQCPDLRLAVFMGCETARCRDDPASLSPQQAVGWRDLVSLAERCVQEVCPLALGMQAVLPFRTERTFTRFFYQGVSSGYSVAECVRRARSAARADMRVGSDLLDWSVPVLYTAGNEPVPLLERQASIRATKRPKRVELRIGLRQSETRFFARDLPLRQSVDVLSGRARERVLVVTGPSGVGKTCLVDRAIDDITPPSSHTLYLRAERLVPEFSTALDALQEGDARWWRHLLSHEPAEGEIQFPPRDRPRFELCRLVAELLTRGDGQARERRGLAPGEWWERLAEDLTRTRFALIFDEFDLFDRLLEACFSRWIPPLLIVALRAEKVTPNTQQLEALAQSFREGFESEAARGIPARVRDAMRTALIGKTGALSPWALDIAARVIEQTLVRLLEQRTTNWKDADRQFARQLRPRGSSEEAGRMRQIANTIDEARAGLESSIRAIAERRSPVRVAVVTTDPHRNFLGLKDNERFEMRLAHLTWHETWRWVRRNLPGLTRFGEQQLLLLWPRLGTDLDSWEELERQVLSSEYRGAPLTDIADEIAPAIKRTRRPSHRAHLRPRGERPLRVAIAGMETRSPRALADALSRMAGDLGVGGRAVFDSSDEPGTLLTLINLRSPFARSSGAVQTSDVLKWLHDVVQRQPDIVLLDFGMAYDAGSYRIDSRSPGPMRSALQVLSGTTLLISAGGNGGPGQIFEPAAFPEVLAIGAIDETGVVRDYSAWHRKFAKPDLYMLDDLAGSPLAAALVGDRFEGTSYAALHAAATASLMWSLLPKLRPGELRTLMINASRPLLPRRGKGPSPRWLTVENALAAMRERLIIDALGRGDCSLQTLAAICGQELISVDQSLAALIARRIAIRVPGVRLDRYRLS